MANGSVCRALRTHSTHYKDNLQGPRLALARSMEFPKGHSSRPACDMHSCKTTEITEMKLRAHQAGTVRTAYGSEVEVITRGGGTTLEPRTAGQTRIEHVNSGLERMETKCINIYTSPVEVILRFERGHPCHALFKFQHLSAPNSRITKRLTGMVRPSVEKARGCTPQKVRYTWLGCRGPLNIVTEESHELVPVTHVPREQHDMVFPIFPSMLRAGQTPSVTK